MSWFSNSVRFHSLKINEAHIPIGPVAYPADKRGLHEQGFVILEDLGSGTSAKSLLPLHAQTSYHADARPVSKPSDYDESSSRFSENIHVQDDIAVAVSNRV